MKLGGIAQHDLLEPREVEVLPVHLDQGRGAVAGEEVLEVPVLPRAREAEAVLVERQRALVVARPDRVPGGLTQKLQVLAAVAHAGRTVDSTRLSGAGSRASSSSGGAGVSARRASALLDLLEAHEIAHFAAGLFRQRLERRDELALLLLGRRRRLAEELAHLEIEDLEDLEERVEADLVLALFHAGEIGLRDADLLGELGLREATPFAQLADPGAHEVNLAGRERGRHFCSGMLLCHKTSETIIPAPLVMSRQSRGLEAKLFLLKEMVVRDIRARYAGSSLGLAWAFAQPVLWMLLYTAVFGLILRAPLPAGFANFPEFLLAGLLPWIAFSEGISRSATALTDNAAMVKKTVFPLETLVASVVLAAVVNEVIGLALYAVFVAWLGHLSASSLLWVLPALAAQVLMTFGLGCLVAAAAVFVRDLVHALGIALTVVFYMTPIVYPASLAPERFRPILRANPLAHLTEWYRDAFTLHVAPEPASLLYVAAFTALAVLSGRALFSRTRPHFADLI